MKKKAFAFIIFGVIFLSGCSVPHYYYSPNVQNVPLFNKGNEFSAQAAGSLGSVSTCFELQAGYAFPFHLAGMASLMAGGNRSMEGSYEDYTKLKYFEGALGFYQKIKESGVFELYIGYGEGSQHHKFTYEYFYSWEWVVEPDGLADISFSKIFIQPDIGYKTDNLEFGVSCRLTALNYKEIDMYSTVHHEEGLNLLRSNSTPWLVEPCLTIRAGSKSVKGQAQLTFIGNLTEPDLAFETCRISLGLYISLGKNNSE